MIEKFTPNFIRIIISSMAAFFFFQVATTEKVYEGTLSALLNDAYIPWIICAASSLYLLFEFIQLNKDTKSFFKKKSAED